MRKLPCRFVPVAFLIASSAQADLVSVDIVKGPFQHPDGLHDTWRVVAFFDNPMDRIQIVVGLDQSPLWFYTGSGELYNQEYLDGIPLNDFPTVGLGDSAEAYDSYLTIGETEFPHNTYFTPDFLGNWGGAPPPVQVIEGSELGPDGDSGWYYWPPDEPPAVGKWNSEVVIAQFTIDKGAGFYLRSGIVWFDTEDEQILTPFEVNNIPAPSAIMLFGLTAMVKRRYRRR